MTGVCPVPVFSPAQFTKAACQFRYATNTHTHRPTSSVCMRAYMEVDVAFLSMCESGACTVSFYNHNPSLLPFTDLHIFTLGTYTAVCTWEEKKLQRMCCVSPLAFLCLELRTLCSVCGSLMYSSSFTPSQPATHINTPFSTLAILLCSSNKTLFKLVGLF